jgi:maleate isomerase
VKILRRLGLIIPSSNTTMETEFYKMLPKGFSLHTARLRLQLVTKEELAKMEEGIEAEALKLADADVDIIGFGCTTGSLLKGLGYDKMIEEKIWKSTGKPAVATAGAVIDALKFLDVKKVAVATPYIDELNKLEEKFLQDNGFEVVDIKGLGIVRNLEIGRLSYETLIRLVTSLRHEEADCIFISCTNFPTVDYINDLERLFKKSVFSSNTATLWAMLRKLRVSIKVQGFGSLLERIV